MRKLKIKNFDIYKWCDADSAREYREECYNNIAKQLHEKFKEK